MGSDFHFDIEKVSVAYSRMNKRQRRMLIDTFRENGLPVKAIEGYTYAEAPGIKHLFFHIEGEQKAVPYFLLEEKWLRLLQDITSL